MKVKKLEIYIEPQSSVVSDATLAPKNIILEDKVWHMPEEMFPRELKFVLAIQELVDEYNRENKDVWRE